MFPNLQSVDEYRRGFCKKNEKLNYDPNVNGNYRRVYENHPRKFIFFSIKRSCNGHTGVG